MADIINVGIAGRVYVRFVEADTVDAQALAVFRRAGARLDRERNLWFVGEHQRAAALTACVSSGGDISGEANPDGTRDVPVGGVELKSGWVLAAATDRVIWFVNPFANAFEENDRGAVIMPVDQVWHLAERSARDDQRKAFCELLEVYNALPRLKVRPAFRNDPAPLPDPPGAPKPPNPNAATGKQRHALDTMLVKLARRDPDRAEELRTELTRLGGFDGITKAAASQLISLISEAIDDAN